MKEYEIIVIGGGPAGLAAAIEAKKKGANKIVVIERDQELGGILQQCIHNGFGLHHFKEELTGPEYAHRFIQELKAHDIEYLLDTMVLSMTKEKKVEILSVSRGYEQIRGEAIILAMGCRERTRGAISIPGERPAGIFSAGTAQRYINMEGYMVGKRVVILGSGDIGLIMARRMTLEGAKVLAVVELQPFSGGLTRNIVQCLDDFDIPLYLSHTVVDIKGRKRLEQVTIAKVDEKSRPIKGTEKVYDCDTLLLSVGLIPENELSEQAGVDMDPVTKGPKVNEAMETSIPGIFACGNVVHVHDLVDYVTAESQRAGREAAKYVLKEKGQHEQELNLEKPDQKQYLVLTTRPLEGIAYIVPQKVRSCNLATDLQLFMRVRTVYKDVYLIVKVDGTEVKRIKRNHLAPGEMESITVAKGLLSQGKQLITVEVRAVE